MANPATEQLALTAMHAATKLRRESGLGWVDPADPIDLAAKSGCEVFFCDQSSIEGLYSPNPKPTIVVGACRPAGRRNFTSAHELAHHIFSDGVSVDELTDRSDRGPTELRADMFAGYLLMPAQLVRQAMRCRGIDAGSLTPSECMTISCYLGVGYLTLVGHLQYALRLLGQHDADILRKTTVRELKAEHGCPGDRDLMIVDTHWGKRAISLEVGDYLGLPPGVVHEGRLEQRDGPAAPRATVLEATATGYSRVVEPATGWAAHVRISRKQYVGLAEYRFLEDEETP